MKTNTTTHPETAPAARNAGKPTKSGVLAALIQRGFTVVPKAFQGLIPASRRPSYEEFEWADYLIADTDFGGAWNDSAQINSHLEAR